MLADMPDGLGRQAEPLEKRLMRLRVPLFKRDMQLAPLLLGDSSVVEHGNELILGDRRHDGIPFLAGCTFNVSTDVAELPL
jgi:hypothetical protein